MRKPTSKSRTPAKPPGTSKVPTAQARLAAKRKTDSARRYRPPAIDAAVLESVGDALARPGLKRSAVFTRPGVQSYSIDPKNPDRIIRETANGQRTEGHVVAGRFRSLPSKQ